MCRKMYAYICMCRKRRIYHVSKALVKRCVFRRFLKISSDGELRMLAGSRFHSVGAAIVKDRSPRVVDDLNAGCSRLIELLDLSERSG